ncbi:Two-component transcriptional response regulator, LuxR family [hydrothermal vent metagenome]|uniref:Two-component transcriptional response regulator, LuxR family n=1 Tax=hydrothermal vent metagenome TaxID=652676 RepID=A0A3B1AEP3_9ZZZZ
MSNDIESNIEHHAIVLLVDDQAMVAEGIRRMLQDETNIEFHYCDEPDKALETAIKINATVILQDLVMPDIDGLTLVRFYKSHPDTKNIPIIVLSSKDVAEIKSDAFSSGANDYLVKLPDAIELIARINAHTKHYLTAKERDDAYQAIQNMQQQLEDANKQLEFRNEELQRLSSLDGLTGVANRRTFDETLKQEWNRTRRSESDNEVSLILIDIDYFKLYNDNYGHQKGDECLKQFSWSLNKCISRDCDLFARYGGEEFVVILSNTDSKGALIVAKRLQKKLADEAIVHEFSSVSKIVTISLGIASITPTENNSPEDIIAKADKALYNAKEHGRNQIIVAS